MGKRTEGVYQLVQAAMRYIAQPCGEDVILEVCLIIEHNAVLRQRYDELGEELRPWVVNNWIGQYTKQLAGMETIRQVDTKKSGLITSYTKLRR
ncbi:MAG: hypothetical protein KJZ86_26685 [Caldilineaceae bacterium]|nr:hypothetical protein [Caldilineaceae bacterium]HRJ43999.1 hypothetical protein [Caldilineaceae bacterium]